MTPTDTLPPFSECPVCHEKKREYLFVARGLQICRCPGCGLLSQGPNPALAESPTPPQLNPAADREASRRFLELLKIRGIQSGRLLVIAAKNHPIAEEATRQGFELAAHLTLQDLNSELTLAGTCDAVIVLHQLEQSPDAAAFIHRVATSLRIGGLLLITTPSVPSQPHTPVNSQWTEWQPEIVNYFDPVTIQGLLLRHSFEKIRIEPAHRRDSSMLVTAQRTEERAQPVVSIIVAAFNEHATFSTVMDTLIAKELPGIDKEIIVVESNSSDGTHEQAKRYQNHPNIKIVFEDTPRGKGHAIRTGLKYATGDVILIQDADLEYDINDYDALLEPLLQFRAPFVLGSRHDGSWKMREFTHNKIWADILNLGHLFFTLVLNLLYRQRMRDPFTMYKVFWRDCLYGLDFECDRFDFDHELVIKLVRKGYTPLELPVNYRSRSFKDGKKIRIVRDPLRWLWVDFKYRFVKVLKWPAKETDS